MFHDFFIIIEANLEGLSKNLIVGAVNIYNHSPYNSRKLC
jgi:hypothetical protein